MLVDKILGNFEERYFGEGHKRSVYSLVETSDSKCNEYQGIAAIKQEESWSEKNGEQMKPHLSTIDGVILATLLAENYLKEFFSEIITEELFITSFEIKAGTKPIEDLQNISMLINRAVVETNDSIFKIDISGMKVELKMKKLTDMHIEPKQLVVTNKSYYSNHLKAVKHDLININFLNANSLFCDVLRIGDNKIRYSGLGSSFSESISALEWLVIFSQLGQVGTYNYDFMDRQESETLWMRWVKAEIDFPYYYEEPVILTGEIVKASLLSKGTEDWRMLDVTGSTIDSKVKFDAKIAHKLPKSKKENSYAN